MATLVIMPRQGQSVESCVITAWNKKVGDKIAVGDVLFSYETDKSSFDETSTVEGTLLTVLAQDGDDVPCLEPVCVIGAAGEDYSSLIQQTAIAENEPTPAIAAAPKADEVKILDIPVTTTTKINTDEIKISPRARNLAVRTDADISKAIATGPHGRIIERDINCLLDKGITTETVKIETIVEEIKVQPIAVEKPQVEKSATVGISAAYTDEKIPNIRKVIAKSMQASLSKMAQLTLNSSFDAAQLINYRAMLKSNAEKLGLENITLNDMLLFAVAKTLKNHRSLNAHFLDDSDTMRYFANVNLGIAVDTDRGLMVPTIFSADTLSLNEIAKESKALIKSAQSGTISPDKLKGATFTVTNLGSLGVESFTPVINPPQTGILGVDTLVRRIKEIDGKDVFYTAMGLSLTFDHRALDGAPAAKFLKELCSNLENFSLLMAK